MTFQSTVLIIAIIILVILLVLVAHLLTNQKLKGGKWPPHVSNCPDFWRENVSNDFDDSLENDDYPKGENICINVHKIGNPVVDVIDFNNTTYTGDKGVCEKQAWAKNHQLTWDGITNKRYEECM